MYETMSDRTDVDLHKELQEKLERVKILSLTWSRFAEEIERSERMTELKVLKYQKMYIGFGHPLYCIGSDRQKIAHDAAREGRMRFPSGKSPLMQDAIAMVKQDMESNDASHDWSHVKRVRRLGRYIAIREHADLEIVDLGLLFHDYKDYKYSGSETIGAEKVADFLQYRLEKEKIKKVVAIMNGISFRHNLDVKDNSPLFLELRVCIDADRLGTTCA